MTNFSIDSFKPSDPVEILTASGVGSTGATSDAGCVRVDLGEKVLAPRFSLAVKVTNSATAPGTSKSVTIFYAWSPELLTNLTSTGAPLELSGGELSLATTLRNTGAAVTRNMSANLEVRARYLYVWYDISALDVSATVSISVQLVWLG